MLLILTVCGTTLAQDGGNASTPPTAPASDLPTMETLAPRIAELEGVAEPTEPQRQELEALRRAVGFLEQRATVLAETAQLNESASTAPTRLQTANEQLARPLEESMPPLPDAGTMTLEQLQTELASARTRLEAARQERTNLEGEFNRRNDRREGIPAEINQARQRLDA